MISFAFHRNERLKSRKQIARLFKEGQTIKAYPLRIVWMEMENPVESPVQFALTVPRRAFKKAAHRNRLRRRLREAYRLHKHELYAGLSAPDTTSYAIMSIYVAREELSFQEIEKATLKWIKIFKKHQES